MKVSSMDVQLPHPPQLLGSVLSDEPQTPALGSAFQYGPSGTSSSTRGGPWHLTPLRLAVWDFLTETTDTFAGAHLCRVIKFPWVQLEELLLV